jgi:hypothetical protein
LFRGGNTGKSEVVKRERLVPINRPEVPIRETEAKHVFDASDTGNDESIHFRGKRRKGDRAVADDGVVVRVGPVIAIFGFCLLVAL